MESIFPNHPSMSSTSISDTFQNLGLKHSVYYIAMSQKKLAGGKYNKIFYHKTTECMISYGSEDTVAIQFKVRMLRRILDNMSVREEERRETDLQWTACLLAFKLVWDGAPPPWLQSYSNKRYLHKICIGSSSSLLSVLTLLELSNNSLGKLSYFT